MARFGNKLIVDPYSVNSVFRSLTLEQRAFVFDLILFQATHDNEATLDREKIRRFMGLDGRLFKRLCREMLDCGMLYEDPHWGLRTGCLELEYEVFDGRGHDCREVVARMGVGMDITAMYGLEKAQATARAIMGLESED